MSQYRKAIAHKWNAIALHALFVLETNNWFFFFRFVVFHIVWISKKCTFSLYFCCHLIPFNHMENVRLKTNFVIRPTCIEWCDITTRCANMILKPLYPTSLLQNTWAHLIILLVYWNKNNNNRTISMKCSRFAAVAIASTLTLSARRTVTIT